MSAKKVQIEVTVNGKRRSFSAHPMARLLDVLREEFKLTGTKEGCGEGECGACSVMMDGELVNSCLLPAIQVQGKKINTIESVCEKRLENAFLKCGGAQCGICTPGMIVAAGSLLKKNKKPTEKEIRYWLSGNLCRCTGFSAIVEAVKEASRARVSS